MSNYSHQLEALQMVGDFTKWMMVVQAGLLGVFAKWVTTGAVSSTKAAKVLTFGGFGGALVLASLRLGFLGDMAQRLDPTILISDLKISHSDWLPDIPMSWLGVPQHILFFVGVVGFAWSAWNLRRATGNEERDARNV